MHPSSFLLAALALAVPSSAIVTSLEHPIVPNESFSALTALQSPGLEFGRFFDAAAFSPARMAARFAVAPAAVSAPPMPSDPAPRRLLTKPGKDRFDATIREEAANNGLDPRLVKSVIAAESEFTPRAKSPAGALGLMQVMPRTASSLGVSGKALFDPVANIRAGTRYLAYLFSRAWARFHLRGSYADAPSWLVRRVIAAYNAGPRWIMERPAYRQTRDYVKRVMLFYGSLVSEVRV